MSKISELRKQYPELNVSIIDVLSKLDGTKSHKYLPLLCKLFSYRFNVKKEYRHYTEKELNGEINYIRKRLSKIIDTTDLSDNELYVLDTFFAFYSEHDLILMRSFKELNERNLITNNDVNSYKDMDEVRNAVSLAEIRMFEKDMEKQIIKEYEDDNWLIVRPLTFTSSTRYGAGTKWCTTYEKEKQYFKRYWERGVLIYVINKKTGYKFASFKSLYGERELSFWNSADQRIDFLEVEIEDYMYSIIKNQLKSTKTNKDFCDNKLIVSVEIECCEFLLKKASRIELVDETQNEVAAPRLEVVRGNEGGVPMGEERYMDEPMVEDMSDIEMCIEEANIPTSLDLEIMGLRRFFNDEEEMSVMEEPLVDFSEGISEEERPLR
jgi:hypothetical protein